MTETLAHGRLRHPMFRADRKGPFRQISWEQALSLLARRFREALRTRGPSSIAIYGSGQFHTEDYFVAQKLLKGTLGSNNFDANSRLCMSSAVSGYQQILGSDGPPCSYSDLDRADFIVLLGTNTWECHPVLARRIRRRRRLGNGKPEVVLIDPRATPTTAIADTHLAIRPGTDLALLYGVGHLLAKRGALDHRFIEERTEGFERYAPELEPYTPERVAAICGIPSNAIEKLARSWASAGHVMTLWSMGINQSVRGTANVAAIIALHLMTGQIGRDGCGPFSLTGQPNAMGGREAGGLTTLLPGYRSVKNAQHRAEMEELWALPPRSISPVPGFAALQQIEAMLSGQLRLWWVAATNPLVSMPNLARVRAAAAACPFIVLSDAYIGTETAAVADLLLPAAQWSERTGTMTNSERRVTLCPAFRRPPGEARPDWQIFAEVGRRLGFARQFSFESAADVFDELARATSGQVCDYSGLSHAVLREHGPQQWPFPVGSTPTSASRGLYRDERFPTENGRARFRFTKPEADDEPTSKAFPLVLTTGRVEAHWHTMTRTRHAAALMRKSPGPQLEIHPQDAAELGVKHGQEVIVETERGEARAPAHLTSRVRRGVVFLPMHWGHNQTVVCEVNDLTRENACPQSKQPALKASAARVRTLPSKPPR